VIIVEENPWCGCHAPQIASFQIFKDGKIIQKGFSIVPGFDYALVPGEIIALPKYAHRWVYESAGAN
jgi:hypothetical protein